MIFDQLDSAGLYGGLGQRIAKGLALLADPAVRGGDVGRYEVDGDALFYMIQEYQTQPVEDGRLEIHQTYMDIQYVVSGTECMGYAPLDGLKPHTPYDGEKDVAFYDNSPVLNRLVFQTGMFVIFWPNEPHLPGRSIDKAETVKKIVIKVRME
jgi:YhcH/YjgK/YiaL family protein